MLAGAGCSPDSPAGGATSARTPSPESGGCGSFVVVGDSITAGSEPIRGREVPGTGSWVPAADAAPLRFAGGLAVPGATTEDLRAIVPQVDGDLLVIMAGTNDLYHQHLWPRIRENILTIAEAGGPPAVVLSAVAPSDRIPEATGRLNRRLRALADEQGWTFLDPWPGIAAGEGFEPGASLDGIHPTPDAAADVGTVIREKLLALC